MAETLYASGLFSGSVTGDANATGAQDGTFTTQAGNSSWTAQFDLDNVAATIAQSQTISVDVYVRRDAATSSPTLTSIELFDGGTSKGIDATGWTISSTGETVSASFAVTSIANNGADLRVELVATVSGGKPADRTTVQLDSITVGIENESADKSGAGTVAAASSTSATGIPIEEASGTGSVTAASSTTATGAPVSDDAEGAGSTTSASSTTATGSGARSGSGAAAATSSTAATGSGPAPSVLLFDDFTDTDGEPWDTAKWTTTEDPAPDAFSTIDIQGNAGRMTTGDGVDDYGVAIADAADVENAEVYMEIDPNPTDLPSADNAWLYVMLLSSGEIVDANAGRPATAYYMRFKLGNTTAQDFLFRRSSNSETQIRDLNTTSNRGSGGEPFRLKYRVVTSGGSDQNKSILYKIWLAADGEPAFWDSYEDTSPGTLVSPYTGTLETYIRNYSGSNQAAATIDNVTYDEYVAPTYAGGTIENTEGFLSAGDTEFPDVPLPQVADGAQDGDIIVATVGGDETTGATAPVSPSYASGGWIKQEEITHLTTGYSAIFYAVVTDASLIPATDVFDYNAVRETVWTVLLLRNADATGVESWSAARGSRASWAAPSETVATAQDNNIVISVAGSGASGDNSVQGDLGAWTLAYKGWVDATVDAWAATGYFLQAEGGGIAQQDVVAAGAVDASSTISFPYAESAGSPDAEGSGSVAATSSTTGTGEGAKSGAATAISNASDTAGAGSGQRSGTGSESAASATTATGLAAFASGSGAVGATSSTSASGVALEAASGSGTVSATSSTSATGVPLEAASGSGAMSAASSTSGTGEGQKEGSGAVASASSTSGSGVAFEQAAGSGTVAASSSTSASGLAAFASGAGATSASSDATATGTGAREGSGAASAASSISGAGSAIETVAGSGSTTSASSISSSGYGDREGSGSIAVASSTSGAGFEGHEDSVGTTNASATSATGEKAVAGSGSATAASDLTASGLAAFASGSGSVSATHSTSASGSALETVTGQGSTTAASSVSGSGYGDREGSSGMAATSSTSASGFEAHEDSGTLSAASSTTATGTKATAGVGEVSASSSTAATGSALETVSGSGSVAASSAADASGYGDRSGSQAIGASSSVGSTGYGDRQGSEAIAAVSDTSSEGTKSTQGTGEASAASSLSATGVASEGASGYGSTTSTSSTSANGSGQRGASGSIAASSSADALGTSARSGSGTLGAASDTAATGTVEEFTDTGGAGSTSNTSGTAASGQAARGGSSVVSAVSSLVAAAWKGAFGAGSASGASSTTAAGSIAAEEREGSGSTGATSSVSASMFKTALGIARIRAGNSSTSATGSSETTLIAWYEDSEFYDGDSYNPKQPEFAPEAEEQTTETQYADLTALETRMNEIAAIAASTRA